MLSSQQKDQAWQKASDWQMGWTTAKDRQKVLRLKKALQQAAWNQTQLNIADVII